MKSTAPLDGVKVLDLTRLLPGPVCTLHLADLGADVIKIEDTGAGDYAAPALRALVNRNKRAIRLDLKQPEGVAALRALARTSDVLVEGFRPGVMDRLGVGYEALAAENPQLVYCSLTGYGQTGPWRELAGHDINYCSVTGVADQIGCDARSPALSNVPIADLLGGSLTAVMGILAALYDAARTGRGRHVDVAMSDSALAHAVVPLAGLAAHGRTKPAGGDKLTGALPCYGMYATADGRFLAVGALERKFWDEFCERLGRPDLKPQHLNLTPDAAARVRAEIAAIVGARPLAHWEEAFRGADCCVSPVLKLEEALQQEHFRARGMVIETAQADGSRLAQIAFPVKMSGYSFDIRRTAPRPGEHTAEILREAGYAEEDIARLAEKRVVA